MVYSESKKLTDTEKRLQTLKTQLFGKEKNRVKVSHNMQTLISVVPSQSQDLTYLRNDLRKIFILATLVIGIQLVLYMQLTFKVLKIN